MRDFRGYAACAQQWRQDGIRTERVAVVRRLVPAEAPVSRPPIPLRRIPARAVPRPRDGGIGDNQQQPRIQRGPGAPEGDGYRRQEYPGHLEPLGGPEPPPLVVYVLGYQAVAVPRVGGDAH